MRIASDDESDPGYPVWKSLKDQGKVTKVFLDGREVPLSCLGDEEQGIVIAAKPDPVDGFAYVEPGTDLIAKETLRGHVEIVVYDPD